MRTPCEVGSLTASLTSGPEQQAWQRDLDQLAELHSAYRRLGSYLAARTQPGVLAVDTFADGGGLGTWIMKLGARIHADAMVSAAQSANAGTWSTEPTAGPDLDQPAMARIVNYVLGDASAFEADRRVAEVITHTVPAFAQWVRDNAGFVRRAVNHMLDSGIRQFLDLGAGMGTTRGSVAQVARHRDPATVRVACIDLDPVAVASLSASADPDGISVHELDLFAVDQVLNDDAAWQLLDPAEPVGVVLTSVLHFEPDSARIEAALHQYHDSLAAGSMLAISHLGGTREPLGELAMLVDVLGDLGFPIFPRSGAELIDVLGPWLPQLDGVVPPRLWQPEGAIRPLNAAHLGNAVLAVKSAIPSEEERRDHAPSQR